MFKDREEAGDLLAVKINPEKYHHPVVYGITKGGLIVAIAISRKLKCQLLPIIVKKIGLAENQELALGAVTYEKITYINQEILSKIGIDQKTLNKQINEKYREVISLKNYLLLHRKLTVKNKEIILVDDGIATGATMLAALKFFQKRKARSRPRTGVL